MAKRNTKSKTPMMLIRHKDSRDVLLEIEGSSLGNNDLRNKNLAGANMTAIQVLNLKPSGDPFVDSQILWANLSGANFSGCDLSGAVFSEELMSSTDFSGANLSGSVFIRSHFLGSKFVGANLTGARFGSTAFQRCDSLADALGLELIDHRWPSSLDAATLRASARRLPDVFLRGIGYSPSEIEQMRVAEGLGDRPLSCFLSYARTDSEFAEFLRRRLLEAGVTCWVDVHDMRGGEFWRGQIYNAIEKNDKVIVICSCKSLKRPVVVEEIVEGISREQITRRQKLFPIRLDDYVLSEKLEILARKKMVTGEWKRDWVTYLRSFHVPDFSEWRNTQRFDEEFIKLLKALKGPPVRKSA